MKQNTDAFYREAARLDAADELAAYRAEFYMPDERIYLDGNSLGLLSRGAERAVLRVVDEWKKYGVEGWTQALPPWFDLADALAARTAELLGAAADEVMVTNSTTVNLHQLMATLFDPTAERKRVLADALAFPSDLYALQSQLRLRGLDPVDHLALVGSRDGVTLDEADIEAAMTPDVQIAVFPAVVYTSGQLLDMERLTRAARDRSICIGFDCSHSIGAVEHALSAWGADFAFWCSYKYLNGGPGATGGLYLNRRHFGGRPGIAGWFSSSKERQFDMTAELQSALDAGALQIGTPNILSMAPLQGALELHHGAGMARLRRKSLALTRLLIDLADAELGDHSIRMVTPRDELRRGGHIALQHPEAARICKALRAGGVVPDYRRPDLIRLAPVPLYTRFVDCVTVMRRLREILDQRRYEVYDPGTERAA